MNRDPIKRGRRHGRGIFNVRDGSSDCEATLLNACRWFRRSNFSLGPSKLVYNSRFNRGPISRGPFNGAPINMAASDRDPINRALLMKALLIRILFIVALLIGPLSIGLY